MESLESARITRERNLENLCEYIAELQSIGMNYEKTFKDPNSEEYKSNKGFMEKIFTLSQKYHDSKMQLENHISTLKGMREQMIQTRQPVDNAQEFYEKTKKTIEQKQPIPASKTEWEKNASYNEFCNEIWGVHHPGATLPWINEENDEGIVAVAQNKSYKCPITQDFFKNPYKSSVCGHVLDEDGIKSSLSGRTQTFTCPYVGCNKLLRWSDMVKDPMTMRAVERYLRDKQKEENREKTRMEAQGDQESDEEEEGNAGEEAGDGEEDIFG